MPNMRFSDDCDRSTLEQCATFLDEESRREEREAKKSRREVGIHIYAANLLNQLSKKLRLRSKRIKSRRMDGAS